MYFYTDAFEDNCRSKDNPTPISRCWQDNICNTHALCIVHCTHAVCNNKILLAAKKRKKPATKLLDSGESPLFPCYVFQVFMAAAFVVFKFCS